MDLTSFLKNISSLSFYLLKNSNWTSCNIIKVTPCSCEEVKNPNVIICMAHHECRQPFFEIIFKDFQLQYCFLIKGVIV